MNSGLTARLVLIPALWVLVAAAVPTESELTTMETYGSAEDALGTSQALEHLLERCNLERGRAGIGRLELNARAVELARGHADEMATERYLNHCNLAGLKCERRFNQIGGLDHVTENLAYYEIRSSAEQPVEVFLTPQLLNRIFTHWMESEVHRANILNPAHTHLGAALAIENVRDLSIIAAAMELTSSYGEYQPLPLSARQGDRLTLQGVLDPALARLAWIGLGIEAAPRQRTAEQLKAQASGYSQPQVKFVWEPDEQAAQRPEGAKQVGLVRHDPATGEFSAELYLARHWDPGAYYFTLWALPVGRDGPGFRTMTQVVHVD